MKSSENIRLSIFLLLIVSQQSYADCWRLPDGQVVTANTNSVPNIYGIKKAECNAQQELFNKQTQINKQQSAQSIQLIGQYYEKNHQIIMLLSDKRVKLINDRNSKLEELGKKFNALQVNEHGSAKQEQNNKWYIAQQDQINKWFYDQEEQNNKWYVDQQEQNNKWLSGQQQQISRQQIQIDQLRQKQEKQKQLKLSEVLEQERKDDYQIQHPPMPAEIKEYSKESALYNLRVWLGLEWCNSQDAFALQQLRGGGDGVSSNPIDASISVVDKSIEKFIQDDAQEQINREIKIYSEKTPRDIDARVDEIKKELNTDDPQRAYFKSSCN